ncbi:MAG: TonB-dependent receptor domain-containing protein [Cyclobacteriaceae bacterium]
MSYIKLSLLATVVFLISVLVASAQPNSSISGRVLDNDSKSPIEYSSVAIFHAADSSLIHGTISNENGQFEFNAITVGKYYLEIRFIGYTTKVVQIEVPPQAKNIIALGDILLTLNTEMLQDVEITGDRLTSTHTIDRQVFKADEFKSAMGGTAVDILRNMPSIAVNADGDIMMRGSAGFMILLDGKPVQGNMTAILNQLPANAIDDIEIITAPSARYDPDGKSGIINIKTKKGSTDGMYFLVNARLGAPSIENFGNEKIARRYGADFTYSVKKNKWDVSIGADYKRDDIAGYRDGTVETYRNDTITSLPSLGERSYRRESYSGRASATYSPNKYHAISASVFGGIRSEERTADILYDQSRRMNNSETPFERFGYFNKNLRERRGDFFIASLDYQRSFDNKSVLTASALYERTILGGPTYNLNLNPNNLLDTLEYQIMDEYNPLDGFRVNLNYVLPLEKNARLEIGYQYRYLIHVGQFAFNQKIIGSPVFTTLPEFGGNIDLQRQIHSLYTQYSKTWEKLSFSAGLRLEHTDRLLESQDGDSYTLELLNLFPSVNAIYDLGKNYRLKGAYSRRIERTTTSMMNPFLARRHSEVLEEGDPELLPELIDAFEIGIVKEFDKHSFFANAYYRHTANVINRVNSVFNDSVLYRTFTNANNAQAYGLEAGTELRATKWWKLYLGGTLYQYAVSGQIFGQTLNQNSLNYSFNINSTFEILPRLDLQFSLNYMSRTVTIQGEDSRFFMPNIVLSKSLMKEQASISLQWMAIGMGFLDTNQQRISNFGNDFTSSTNYIKEVDMVMINFSYRINELTRKLKFNKSEFGEQEF